MTPSDKVAARYADIFVSLFDSIGAGAPPVLSVGTFPQQNLDGSAFKGGNAMLTSMVAASRGYGIPVWLTMARKDDLGLMVKPGERSVPIVHYDVYYEDKATQKRDPAMDDAKYNALPAEEKEKWVKRCYMRCYPEFNICQTNFSEMYPEQWDELVQAFGAPERVSAEHPLLDRLAATGDGWLCPLFPSENDRFSYNEGRDEIRIPEKSLYADEGRYYGDFLYILARSTGSEGRLDRNISSGELNAFAREELVSELASATLGTLAGVQAMMQEHNLVNLKSWVTAIQAEPAVIYKAVNDAAKAADMVSGTLGFELRKGFDVQKVMDDVEKARQAREETMQRRKKRAENARKGHRKGWSPVKAGKAVKMKI